MGHIKTHTVRCDTIYYFNNPLEDIYIYMSDKDQTLAETIQQFKTILKNSKLYKDTKESISMVKALSESPEG